MTNTVLPAFKEKYVATGKVKFVIRPFARNTLDAAIFMLAEHAAKSVDGGAAPSPTDPSAPSSEASAEPAAPADPSNPSGLSQAAIETYDNVLTAYFKTQQEWGTSSDPLTALKTVATQLGFSEAAFNEALTNQELFNGIDAMRNLCFARVFIDVELRRFQRIMSATLARSRFGMSSFWIWHIY